MNRHDPQAVIEHVRGLAKQGFMISHEFVNVLLQELDDQQEKIKALQHVTHALQQARTHALRHGGNDDSAL